MPVSLHLLNQFWLMRALGEQEMAQLSQKMVLREYARRAVVVSKESSSGELGFLVDGRLQGVDFTVDGRSVGLYFVDPGDYFGELPLLDGKAPAEYLVAAAKSTAAFLDGHSARALITHHPEIAQAVMQRLAERVRTTMAQRTLLSLPNPFQRLCALLLQLPAHKVGNALEVSQAPTHQELAIMINASRETVTRGFQVLFLRGVLTREGQALRVVDPTILQHMAQGREGPPRA
jgi:CRP-like cAMP-binding protein